MKRFLLLCGVAAPIVYLCTVIYGGVITPGYSHIAHAISELVAEGAPLRWRIDPGFILYNQLMFCFCAGLFVAFRERGPRIVGLMIAGIAIASDLMYWFAMDPRGAAPTLAGNVHWALATIISLLTIAATLGGWFFFRGVPGLDSLRPYALATGLVLLVSGPVTVAAAVTQSSLFGLIERVTIGGYIQFVFVIALRASTRYLPRRAAV